MKNCLVCIVALLVLLAGCAPKIWHRHGATQDDYKRVKLVCEKEANQSGYAHNVFNICMAAKVIPLRKNNPNNYSWHTNG